MLSALLWFVSYYLFTVATCGITVAACWLGGFCAYLLTRRVSSYLGFIGSGLGVSAGLLVLGLLLWNYWILLSALSLLLHLGVPGGLAAGAVLVLHN